MAKNKPKKKQNKPNLSAKEKRIVQQARQFTKAYVMNDNTDMRHNENKDLNDALTKLQPKLSKQYYEACIASEVLGQPKDVVLSGNIIEMPENWTELYDKHLVNQTDYSGWTNKEGLLHVIPCFRTGVLKEPREDEVQYTKWTIDRVDITGLQLDMTLEKYTCVKQLETWAPGPRLVINLDFSNPQTLITNIDETKSTFMADTVTCIPYSKLGWSPFEIELWKNTSVYMARMQDTIRRENDMEDINIFTIRDFLINMYLVNTILSSEKPLTERKPYRKKEKKAQFEFDPSKQDERRIRTFSTIKIKSNAVPRTPTERSVTKYSVASWNTRGHIRHYKSGKTVYVKPSIHHRHALQINESTPAPTTIQITNGKKTRT